MCIRDSSCTGQIGWGTAGVRSVIDVAGPGIGCRNMAGVHSCTAGIAGTGRVGAASDTRYIGMVVAHADTDTTGAVGSCVHAVIVCIGIDGAYTGLARVAVGCVAACWVCTDCIGIDKAGTV